MFNMLVLSQDCIDVLLIPLLPYQKNPQRIFTPSLLPRRVSLPQIPVFRTQRSGSSKLNITPLGNVPFLGFLENTNQPSDIFQGCPKSLRYKILLHGSVLHQSGVTPQSWSRQKTQLCGFEAQQALKAQIMDCMEGAGCSSEDGNGVGRF